MSYNYIDSKASQNELKIAELLTFLPKFCHDYIISISGFTKPLTQLAYLQRIQFFLYWLLDNNIYFSKKYAEIKDFTIDDINQLKKIDFEEFFYHISIYGAMRKEKILEANHTSQNIIPTKTATRNNYLSALKSLYTYFLDNEYISNAPVLRIRQRTLDKHQVIALDNYQINQIMDVINHGSSQMSDRQEYNRGKTYIRDKAIYTLALNTGIRVSELVSLDIGDIDFRRHCFNIIRKRGKEDTVYFSDSVEAALLDWLEIRPQFLSDQNEQALFLSTQGSKKGLRLSVRSVEILVKKYAKIGAPEIGSKITPHKLRSSYATKIIEKTGGDINYAKNVLGHENITTTTHYIKDNEKQKELNRNLLDT